jgi:hypothetical protein
VGGWVGVGGGWGD